MSTRIFCDGCDKDMTAEAKGNRGGTISADRLGASLKKRGKEPLNVEVITSKGQCANEGDFCTHCILDALYLLDDRPRAAKAQRSAA